MKICIYRGTNEIGGNCIELATDTTRILLDVGTPLTSMEENMPLDTYRVPVRGLYVDQTPDIDAIFISHGHPDHYGLMPLVNPKIPVYMTPVVRDTLTQIQPLLPDEFDISHLDVRTIRPQQSVRIGDMTITAYAVDHAPAAVAYEISDGKQRVVYTGDIRFHSSQAYRSWMFANAIKNPDYLIMEGTRLSRTDDFTNEKYPSERAVRDGITNLISGSGKLAYITMSSQNLDRLCSLISACARTGRTFVIDPYTAALLDLYHREYPSVPNADMAKCIKIYFGIGNKMADKMKARNLFFAHADRKITAHEILAQPDKFVVKYNWRLAQWLYNNGVTDYDFIYSIWHGYRLRETTWDKHLSKLTEIHTSGHASSDALGKFVRCVAPKKIIPVHTECKDLYQDMFGVPTMVLNDNQEQRL